MSEKLPAVRVGALQRLLCDLDPSRELVISIQVHDPAEDGPTVDYVANEISLGPLESNRVILFLDCLS